MKTIHNNYELQKTSLLKLIWGKIDCSLGLTHNWTHSVFSIFLDENGHCCTSWGYDSKCPYNLVNPKHNEIFLVQKHQKYIKRWWLSNNKLSNAYGFHFRHIWGIIYWDCSLLSKLYANAKYLNDRYFRF